MVYARSIFLSKTEPARFPSRFKFILTIVPPLAFLTTAIYYGPLLIDDAYITFRYAENLAAGHGLVYNPGGEAVLGTTAPLFAVLLGLFKLLGFSVPEAARWTGIIAGAAVVYIVQRFAVKYMGPVSAALLALCVALHPDILFAANSGMETCLSMAAVYGTLLLAFRSKYRAAGILGGVAFLLRPDGAVALVLAGVYTLFTDRRRGWEFFVLASVVMLPWLFYAVLTYGTPIPHTIKAKQLLNPASAPLVLIGDLKILLGWFPMRIAGILAAVGMVMVMLRRSELIVLSIWMGIYLAGLSACRIFNPYYSWYITPLEPCLLLFAACGVKELAETVSGRMSSSSPFRTLVSAVTTPLFLVIMAALFVNGFSYWRTYRKGERWRVDVYLVVGQWLRERCRPGNVVLVGEVGAVGYVLADQVILDGSGINSPEVYRARKEDRERLIKKGIKVPPAAGSADMIVSLISRFRPRYIFTFKRWLHIEEIMLMPQIKKEYRRIKFRHPIMANFIVLERRQR